MKRNESKYNTKIQSINEKTWLSFFVGSDLSEKEKKKKIVPCLFSPTLMHDDAESANTFTVVFSHFLSVQTLFSTLQIPTPFLNDQDVLKPKCGGAHCPRQGQGRNGAEQGQRHGQRHELVSLHRRGPASHGGLSSP